MILSKEDIGENTMFDFKFDWRDELNVGIAEIDEQHREMFRIVRDMEQLLITQCINVEEKQLYEIIRRLREYISYHFYDEEVLMKKNNYTGIEEHTKEHREFYDYIIGIDIPSLGKDPCNSLKSIKDTVQDYIFNHMMYQDKRMADEIKENMK